MARVLSGRLLAPALVALTSVTFAACAETRGTAWMAQPLGPDDLPPMPSGEAPPPAPRSPGSERAPADPSAPSGDAPARESSARPVIGGRSLGTFRNTYYDFPSEADHTGAKTPLRAADCSTIADVPRGFHDAVCVQGSGRLASGRTVSFAKRDCACAETCPRTGQRICFEALDPARFPFGRGAQGNSITPLRSVAVDSTVVPLGTKIYIPELDGVPRSEGANEALDGCFVAEDRGVRVVGNHVDVFTGSERTTRYLNGVVPSNKGVTVVLDSPRCK